MSARSQTPDADPSRTAVFTGTFDPITLGHLDVIRRGRLLFDHLVVGIGVNPNKAALFTIDERVELARRVVAAFDNVSVESFEELTVQFVSRIGARVILRGVRTLSDMEYEFGMSLTNYRLDPSVETVFLMADGEYSHVSSSLIKQVARYGGGAALGRFVPAELVDPIIAKLREADRKAAERGRIPGESRTPSDDATAFKDPF
jgi:pantetheine-phosphate adenylyltransferase